MVVQTRCLSCLTNIGRRSKKTSLSPKSKTSGNWSSSSGNRHVPLLREHLILREPATRFAEFLFVLVLIQG